MPDRNDIQKRKTIPNDVIKTIQQKCQQRDDELRWFIGLISDTGLRLSEALGLCKDEIHLNANIPFIDIRTHSWRRLKTRTRSRKIPDLLGEGSMAPSVNIGLPVK